MSNDDLAIILAVCSLTLLAIGALVMLVHGSSTTTTTRTTYTPPPTPRRTTSVTDGWITRADRDEADRTGDSVGRVVQRRLDKR
jgi:hypothetical protein